jgi:hypothetical protein
MNIPCLRTCGAGARAAAPADTPRRRRRAFANAADAIAAGVASALNSCCETGGQFAEQRTCRSGRVTLTVKLCTRPPSTAADRSFNCLFHDATHLFLISAACPTTNLPQRLGRASHDHLDSGLDRWIGSWSNLGTSCDEAREVGAAGYNYHDKLCV